MVRLPDAWTTDPISMLVRAHFPELNEKTPEGVAFLVQPEDVKQTKREQADAFRRRMAELPADELNIAIAEGKKLAEKRYLQWRSAELAKPFYARVTAEMDVDHWSRTAYWTVEEAAALSFGKDPREVTSQKLRAMRQSSRFAAEFLARLDILERARAMHQLSHSTSLTRFLAWIDHTGFPMPENLMEAAKAIHRPEVDWKAEYEKLRAEMLAQAEKIRFDTERLEAQAAELDRAAQAGLDKANEASLSARERTSLLTLVIGMAVAWYGYDAAKSRSSTAKDISDELHRVGLSLSDDTIRAYLQEARDLLPPPETEQKR
jgi:hypothetical protein